MPIIEVTMLQGRSVAKRADLIGRLTVAAAESLALPLESVRVILHEIPPENYAVAGLAKAPPA